MVLSLRDQHPRGCSLKMNFVLVFLILLVCLLRITGVTAQSLCNNSYGNFTAGSTDKYGANRNLILSSLSSRSNGGFYTGSIGTGIDTVYALSFCWGDSTAEQCKACLNATALELIQTCPNQKKATSWGAANRTADPPCVIRYSNSAVHGMYETSPRIILYNTGDLTMNQTQFDEIWLNLTQGLASEAAGFSSKQKYATDEAVLPNFRTIFSLTQCSPDLPESYCHSCLVESIDDYQSCCRGKQGGVVLKPSCIFRWDLYPFYGSTPSPLQAPPQPPPPPAPPPLHVTPYTGGNKTSPNVIIIVVVVVVFVVFFISVMIAILKIRRRKKLRDRVENEAMGEINTADSQQFNFGTIKTATDGFSEERKLGRGGFGVVYKGMLPNGHEIAVKRLASNSGQGKMEFENEVTLLSRLQHRNLVRLFGFSLQGSERLLIYEYVPNSSLDRFLFDPVKCRLLDWETRHRIILGIARGLLYLHEDSRLRIIHRDMKTSNILLDQVMNPKISDFGMARLFTQDQIGADTNRIVGTYGYMSPEYAMHGNFSVKSDVYSFGVMVLEIVSGKRNNSLMNEERVEYLISSAWRNWTEGTISNIIDPSLTSGSRSEIDRCLHIGLLCVQENITARPNMASVVLMFNSHSMTLQEPTRPGFLIHNGIEPYGSGTSGQGSRSSTKNEFSESEALITELYPR